MAEARDPWWLRAMTIVVCVLWVMGVTPLAKTIVPPDRLPTITGVLTLLIGAPIGLKVMRRQ